MALKFLSDEWAQTFTEALNQDEGFKNAAGNQNVKVQQVVNTPEGEKKFYLKLEGGQVEVGTGEMEGPEATITQDYDTAVSLYKASSPGPPPT